MKKISKVLFVLAVFSTIILFGFKVQNYGEIKNFMLWKTFEDADAKNYVKDAKKQLKEAEKGLECANENAEKVMFYLNQDPPKFYNQNINCEESEQYKYDRLNELAGINEYEDSKYFVLSNEDDKDEDEDDDD